MTGRAATSALRLSRAGASARGLEIPTAPIRVVHLGAGAFHRAHQAWYLARAAPEWGIAAFTGRNPKAALTLAPQDGLFTLVERGADADSHEIVGSIVGAYPSSEEGLLADLLAAPTTAIVTLTVTEAGYHLDGDGALDVADADVAHDLVALRDRSVGSDAAPLRTPLARLARGLRKRSTTGSTPLAVVPCDNLPGNGALVEAALREIFERAGWGAPEASFVTTSVDRITPRTTPEDIAAVAAVTGWIDEAAVVTEPFADWTMSGEFPSGSPDWHGAGVTVVDDIEPYEQRKLLLLNGGHLALAFAGLLEGAQTVAEATAAPASRRLLAAFWADAAPSLDASVDATAYCRSLEQRFSNPRIEHLLGQVAVDTVTKLRVRVIPVLQHELRAGRDARGATAVLRDWAECARRGLIDITDLPEATAQLGRGLDDAVRERIRDAVAPSHRNTPKES